MATKQSTKATKASKNRAKRIPSVKRLESVRTLSAVAASQGIRCITFGKTR